MIHEVKYSSESVVLNFLKYSMKIAIVWLSIFLIETNRKPEFMLLKKKFKEWTTWNPSFGHIFYCFNFPPSQAFKWNDKVVTSVTLFTPSGPLKKKFYFSPTLKMVPDIYLIDNLGHLCIHKQSMWIGQAWIRSLILYLEDTCSKSEM